jgi:hypothetical protein
MVAAAVSRVGPIGRLVQQSAMVSAQRFDRVSFSVDDCSYGCRIQAQLAL